jgi:outer membrane usher protein
MLILQCLFAFIRRLAVLLLIATALFSVRQLYAQDLTRVILNNNFKGNIAITFYSGVPCLTRPLLEEWGVQKSLVEGLKWTDFGCVMPSSLSVNHIEYWYRPKAGLLTLLIPEPVIIAQQNGVSTSRWSDGVNAAFTNYQLSASHEDNRHDPEQSGNALTLDLDNGVNVGPWRMRYKNSLWREQSGDHGSYTREASVYRSFTALRSRMTLGDGYTSNNMFTSLPYRGVSLASDEAMFPDSWRPFSPWINGYARSNADVSIYQNGERVYRIQVPPGPFTIRDFYPPSPDGNLELVIQESKGNERRRTLPYTSMPTWCTTKILVMKRWWRAIGHFAELIWKRRRSGRRL